MIGNGIELFFGFCIGAGLLFLAVVIWLWLYHTVGDLYREAPGWFCFLVAVAVTFVLVAVMAVSGKL